MDNKQIRHTKELLDQGYKNLWVLEKQAAQYASRKDIPLKLYHDINEVKENITALEENLRANGIDYSHVGEVSKELPIKNSQRTLKPTNGVTINITDNEVGGTQNVVGGDMITVNKPGVIFNRVRFPFFVFAIILFLFVLTNIITAGASFNGFKEFLKNIGLISPKIVYSPVPRSDISWNPGSNGNEYKLPNAPEAMEIYSIPKSHPNFPKLTYPMSGDFEAKVTVTVNPSDTHPSYNLSAAGMGIMSQANNSSLLEVIAFFTPTAQNISGQDIRIGAQNKVDLGISNDTIQCNNGGNVYLKIRKIGKSVTSSCSKDGVNWIIVGNGFNIDFGDAYQIFLYAYSTNDNSITASFNDFEVAKIDN